MKTEDFYRLKEICEKENIAIQKAEIFLNGKEVFFIERKDPWEGVEFVEYLNYHLSGGQRYFKVNYIDSLIHIDNGFFHKNECKPSTEQTYIEQLKEIAYDKFGEIKDGDRFINPNGGKDKRCKEAGWAYRKELDWLYYGTCMLYKQGKWATKLPERVRVEFHDWEYRNSNTANVSLIFHIPKWSEVQDKDDIGEHLAKQLENYLNDEKQD